MKTPGITVRPLRADHRRGRVQRGLLRQRAGARREPGRQAERGMGRRHHHARVRARSADLHPAHLAANALHRLVRLAQERGQGNDPIAAAEARRPLDRRAGPAAQRLPQPHQDPARRGTGARGLDVQALLEPDRPGAGARRHRGHRAVLADRRTARRGRPTTASGSSTSCWRGRAASAPEPPRSSETSWPSASSACRRTEGTANAWQPSPPCFARASGQCSAGRH